MKEQTITILSLVLFAHFSCGWRDLHILSPSSDADWLKRLFVFVYDVKHTSERLLVERAVEERSFKASTTSDGDHITLR